MSCCFVPLEKKYCLITDAFVFAICLTNNNSITIHLINVNLMQIEIQKYCRYWHPVFCISASAKFFLAFSHWNFANSSIFSPIKNRRFCFPPKTVDSHGSRRLALVCLRNRGEKLQNLDEGPFFLRSHLNRTKMMRTFSAFSHWV